MMVKETIAVIGLENYFPVFLKNPFKKNYRILLVNKNEDELKDLINQLDDAHIKAEIETVNCPKDGCWEADIILLFNPEKMNADLFEKIRKVSIQKIIVWIEKNGNENELQFPLSKQVFLNSEKMQLKLREKDLDAVEKLEDIFESRFEFKILE